MQKQKIFNTLLPKIANRYGSIASASGTGKTVTLQSLAEGFSALVIPVFMVDVKGNLAGISQAGSGNPKVDASVAQLELSDFKPQTYPVTFWDVFGKMGHPVRTTIAEMGPLLLAHILNLTDAKGGVLNSIFKTSDDKGWLLLDLKDLRAMSQHAAENAAEYQTAYGNMSATSVGTLQRALLQIETEKGDQLFGEPTLNLDDLMQIDSNGRGVINILASDQLFNSPRVYAGLLLWLLSDLYEKLHEVGDLEKPKLVFFFYETHLLTTDAPPVLLQKIEQVISLVRSKGVGVYFVSQNPLDIPDIALGQLGNLSQHALRAFTLRDQKAVKSAAETFKVNPKVDVAIEITKLGVGEALISFLDEKGIPTPVERAFIIPPQSRICPITDAERAAVMQQSLLAGVYEKQVDKKSAYEILTACAAQLAPQAEEGKGFDWGGMFGSMLGGGKSSSSDNILESAAKSAAHAIDSQLGLSIVRGVLGSTLGRH